jgi:hypothetical protein
MGEKYIPVHKLTRPMRLDLTLNEARAVFRRASASITDGTVTDQSNVALGSAYPVTPYPGARAPTTLVPGYTVTDVRLHLGYVQIDDETQAAVTSAAGDAYAWAAQTYRHYRNNTQFLTATLNGSTSGTAQIPRNLTSATWYTYTIPAHLSSARAALSVWRESATLKEIYGRYTSAFPRAYTLTAQYKLGQKPVPVRPMQSLAAMARNFYDVFRRYDAPGPACGSLVTFGQEQSTFVEYDLATALPTTTAADNGGGFCMAVDLGGPCGNDSKTFMGGANTLGEELTLTTSHLHSPSSSAYAPYYLDTYVLHDVLYEIDKDGNFTVTI